jgi:hypothetical protein
MVVRENHKKIRENVFIVFDGLAVARGRRE